MSDKKEARKMKNSNATTTDTNGNGSKIIRSKICSKIHSIIPLTRWLPQYEYRHCLPRDLIAGFTVLALHIPQGLAYGRLAGVEPIYGLYVSLFPAIVYTFMGTSRHISIGTFAVVSIACRDVLNNNNVEQQSMSGIHQIDPPPQLPLPPTSIELLTALAFLVGFIQCLASFLRLGTLITLLPDSVISSFVIGASMHVFTSQLFALFGIKSSTTLTTTVPSWEQMIPFVLVKTWIRLASQLPQANWITILISTCTLSTLFVCKQVLEPFLIRKCATNNKANRTIKHLSLPIDIVCIILLTVFSYVFELNTRYQVDIIPKISSSFTNIPTLPRFDSMISAQLFTSALVLSLVIYVTTYSLGKTLADKHDYVVDANQELLALGTANLLCSFAQCYPCSGSVSRSAVQDKVGGQSQVVSLISSALIVAFILCLSPYLSHLPKCTLSCIIIVALCPTLRKVTECAQYWRVAKLDGLQWTVTFITVVLFGVDRGLLYGLACSILCLLIRLSCPEINLKHRLPEEGDSVEKDNNSAEQYFVCESTNIVPNIPTISPGILVFDYHGPLIRLNANIFVKKFTQLIVKPLEQRIMYTTAGNSSPPSSLAPPAPISTIIFDCARLSYIDQYGMQTLTQLAKKLRDINNIRFWIASTNGSVLKRLKQSQQQKTIEWQENKTYWPSVHDAVVAAVKMGLGPMAQIHIKSNHM